jgi:CheY-like chemotaxis protein
MRVLAVDDDIDTREFFKSLFGAAGVECDVAADGFEACEAVGKRGGYDFYFIDWRMPGMDGIELASWIKERQSNEPHVVVMISATDWSEIKDAAVSAGVNRYLLKPLLSSAIIDCINDCLGSKRGDGGAGADNEGGEFAGKRMLLAEDIEINREIVISLLEGTGLLIDCAENGSQALDMVTAEPGRYDVVFMDVQMPQIDGLEATRQIRSLNGRYFKNLPIVAMTANVFKDDIERCLAAGMDGHIGKPLDIDEVMEMLWKYLI